MLFIGNLVVRKIELGAALQQAPWKNSGVLLRLFSSERYFLRKGSDSNDRDKKSRFHRDEKDFLKQNEKKNLEPKKVQFGE